MLQINDLSYRVGARLLLDRATFALSKGQKAALVGRNGTGKTTLLKLINGELAPSEGAVSVNPRTRIGLTRQEAPAGEHTLIETVLATDIERAALLAEADTAADPHRIGEIHTRLADISAHTAEARAATILHGLGFDADAQQRPCTDFSGGWRMRVALAGLLFSQPDLLLLDEPTNHLDLEATLWLESYLKAYPYTILLVSHDRAILNSIGELTIHIDRGRAQVYNGNYDRFERTRAEHLSRQSAIALKQAAERKRIEAFIERFRYKASKARQAQSRIKQLEKMAPIAAPENDSGSALSFLTPEPLSPPLIRLEDVTVGYDDKPVLHGLNIRLDTDDRVGLLGSNGNGKSTFVKLLADRLKPMAGKVQKSSKLKIGYFAQHQADEFNLTRTVLAEAQKWMPKATEQKVRNHLGRFGFGEQRIDTLIGNLSGGEKARLLFALMSREAPHVLLLDEPTNHLDVDSRQALVQAINEFEGAVVLISHDPHLMGLCADRFWLVDGGDVSPFDGDMVDYRRFLAEKRRVERPTPAKSTGANNVRKDARRDLATQRAQLQPLKKKVQAAELRMTKLQKLMVSLEAALADPKLYAKGNDEVVALQKEHALLKEDLETAELSWLEEVTALEEKQAALEN
jgi:ATP-binding cassette subfamily F protein 3